MTHRELCRRAAAWLLKMRWCHVAGYEVGGGGGVLDAAGVSSPLDAEAGDATRAERERVREEWVSACARWAVDQKGKRPLLNLRWGVEPDRKGKPRITAVEVKRTRSDLLADLRTRKMLRYHGDASHCALAVGEEVSPGLLDYGSGNREAFLAELDALGLPAHWGVVALRPKWDAVVIRAARRHRDVSVGEVRMWTYRIGKSLAYRVTSDSPVAAEVPS